VQLSFELFHAAIETDPIALVLFSDYYFVPVIHCHDPVTVFQGSEFEKE
jgi:hypothetical protein